MATVPRPAAPLAADVDVTFCAESFELAGGNIRSAATTAAYLAAEAHGPVTMTHAIAAVAQEYPQARPARPGEGVRHFLQLLTG